MYVPFFIVFTVVIGTVDLVVAGLSFHQGDKKGRRLGAVCLFCVLVAVSYLLSTIWNDRTVTAIFSSLYFLSIDCTLISTLFFARSHTKRGLHLCSKILIGAFIAYAGFEGIIFSINPFTEIAVSFVPRAGAEQIAFFEYDQHPLFWMHLLYTYLMIVFILLVYVKRTISLPRQYRGQYVFVIISILVIVFLNAAYLFLPIGNVFGYYDLSLAVYTLTAIFLYIGVYAYAKRAVINRFRSDVLDIIDQGIVLFDNEGNYLLENGRFKRLFPDAGLSDSPSMLEFSERTGLGDTPKQNADSFSTQIFQEKEDGLKTVRCDFRRLRDKKNKIIGYLFCFSDASADVDLLTGFHTQAAFGSHILAQEHVYAKTVACCDLNALSLLNSSQGNRAGDQAIKGLADSLRKSMPGGTSFVRGKEATLFALLPQEDEAETKAILSKIWHAYPYSFTYSFALIQSNETILDAMARAEAGLRSRKLLDRDSIHSAVIGSLVKALEQTDSDTEAHVQRTGAMARKVGEMLGLSEVDQSKLAVLSILHDIGKIGIPLEILNKPGRLTDSEFAIIRSHVDKGYAIAKSSPELENIADDIRHHHERWDGKGYPDGLSRETIPLLCRIISVIDSFDAMTHDRVYRKALSVPEAIEELRRCAGTQFDPHVTNVFLQYLTKEEKEAAPGQAAPQETAQKTKKPVFEARKETDACHEMAYARILLTEEDRVVAIDEAFTSIFGYTESDVKEKNLSFGDLFPQEHRIEVACAIEKSVSKTNIAYLEAPMIDKAGKGHYIFLLLRRHFDPITKEGRSEVFFSDSEATFAVQNRTLKEEKKALARLQKWEETYRVDALTGLLNHVAFQNDVELKLLSDDSVALMIMVDIDDFKSINNEQGHREGDKVLVAVAGALRSALRKEDLACRMGGDEFALVLYLPSGSAEEVIRERAEAAYAKMSSTLKKAGIGVTLSAGAASTACGSASFDGLYEAADRALYQAKGQGKARISIAVERNEEETAG